MNDLISEIITQIIVIQETTARMESPLYDQGILAQEHNLRNTCWRKIHSLLSQLEESIHTSPTKQESHLFLQPYLTAHTLRAVVEELERQDYKNNDGKLTDSIEFKALKQIVPSI